MLDNIKRRLKHFWHAKNCVVRAITMRNASYLSLAKWHVLWALRH